MIHDSIYTFFQNLKTQYPPESITQTYHKGVPTPYHIIDNFLPQDIYDAVIATFSNIPEERYKIFQNELSERKECRNFSEVPLLQTLANSFNSKQFVDWLEETTQSETLIPDPHFLGGGFCRSSRNTTLGLHTDFNWNNTLKLNRKNNAILYMNQEWQPEWNGHLEFWDDDKTKCLIKVEPKPNRFIFWDYGYNQVHGHPEPILCPEHLSRDSLILFYYQSNATWEKDPRRSQFYK